jgi:hypothetical protein
MDNIILIAIIVIGVALVAVALLVWRRQKEEKPERISSTQKKAFFVQFVIGIAIALMADIFMFDGDILGENTAGISTVLGIIGIGLIATSNISLLPLKRK